jgi:hypothetical protein
MAMAQCEVWVMVDANGDYVASHSKDALGELYEADIGYLSECEGIRRVKVVLAVPLPEVVELTGTAPECGGAELTSVV